MDVFGRDDELRSLHAFLDRPAAAGMAGLVLEGEAGIGKSTIWLAGVEAARERGLRVLSSRPAEVELGVAYAGLGDLLEDALDDVAAELAAPRRRALETALLVGDDADEPVDFRTLAVAVRSALHVLAERRADPGRGRRRPVARRVLEQRAGVRAAAAAGTGPSLAARSPAGERRRGVRGRARAGRSTRRARTGRSAQPGRAARDPSQPRLGRVVRAADAAPPARSFGRQPVLRARARPRPRRRTSIRLSRCPFRSRSRRSSALASTGCRTRRARALLLACAHGRLTPAQLDRDALEPAFADARDRARRRCDPVHAPAARLRALSGGVAGGRRRAHERSGRDRRRSARARPSSRACSG